MDTAGVGQVRADSSKYLGHHQLTSHPGAMTYGQTGHFSKTGKANRYHSSTSGSIANSGCRIETRAYRIQIPLVDFLQPVALSHITEMVGNFAAHLTRDEMAYGAQERGLNWGSIRAPDELVDEGHLNDRGFWVEVPHPELDRSFKYPGPAGIYNGSPWRISRRAPLIGEHNEEIYCGELGLQRTELAYLAESGVV